MDISTMNAPHYLFSKGELREILDRQLQALKKEIDSLPADTIINTTTDEYVTYFTKKYQITVPVLREKEIHVDDRDAKIDVSNDPTRAAFFINPGKPTYVTGTTIIYEIPFVGDPSLFDCRPNTWTNNVPEGTITGNTLRITYTDTNHDARTLKARFDRDLANLKDWLSRVDTQLNEYNSNVPGEARAHYTNRRDKLTKDKDVVSNLGYPVRRRADAPTITVPITRKPIPAPRPTPATPEPLPITDAVYEDILTTIQSMAVVIERNPTTFHHVDEGFLRTLFLVTLNADYKGEATGETFNTKGKTDILIRHENKNLFIAECKFWDGPASLTGTIDQLLGYAQWRDTKTAILLFNRNKNFTAVIKQIPGIVQAHPNFVQQHAFASETGYRCTMRQKNDPQRHLTLTIVAFDIPTE